MKIPSRLVIVAMLSVVCGNAFAASYTCIVQTISDGSIQGSIPLVVSPFELDGSVSINGNEFGKVFEINRLNKNVEGDLATFQAIIGYLSSGGKAATNLENLDEVTSVEAISIANSNFDANIFRLFKDEIEIGASYSVDGHGFACIPVTTPESR